MLRSIRPKHNVSGSGPEDWAVRRDVIRPGSVPSRPASHHDGAMGILGDMRYVPVFQFDVPVFQFDKNINI